MKTRLIVPAILSAMMLGAPVLAQAASMDLDTAPSKNSAHGSKSDIAETMQDRCIVLEKQFDATVKDHATATKIAQAKTLRKEGANFCRDSQPSKGVTLLEDALNDIGVTPKG